MEPARSSWHQLRDALLLRDFEKAGALLQASPALAHLSDEEGETVLHVLVLNGDIDGVAWLYARGAEVDTRNCLGIPALFEAASRGHKELFCWLVAHGADCTVVDRSGRSLVRYLVDCQLVEMAEWVDAQLAEW